jgi:acyl-CoA thioesterase FadM
MKERSNFAFMVFEHKLYNEMNELIHKAEVILTFFDPIAQKRCKMPDVLFQLIKPHFNL